jgi:hypothetical protein
LLRRRRAARVAARRGASHRSRTPAGKMGECEANSVHLSKREKFLAEQGKKA